MNNDMLVIFQCLAWLDGMVYDENDGVFFSRTEDGDIGVWCPKPQEEGVPALGTGNTSLEAMRNAMKAQNVPLMCEYCDALIDPSQESVVQDNNNDDDYSYWLIATCKCGERMYLAGW